MIGVVARFHHFNRLMHTRIEGLTLRGNRLYANAREDVVELLANELDTRAQSWIGGLILLASQSEIEVVEYGKKVLHHVCSRVLAILRLLAGGALARIFK